MALCAAIFWGTFFPLISELFTGNKSSLAAPWFDRYTTPLAILLVLFTGIGPLLAWRRVSWASARRVFRAAGDLRRGDRRSCSLVATDAARKPWAFALFVFAAFALAGLAQEFWQGAAARRAHRRAARSPAALLAVTSRNRRRYGGYVVHAGVAVLLIGIAASSSFQTNREVTLRPGQSTVVDGRTGHLRAADRQRRQPGLHRRRRAAGDKGRRSLHPVSDPTLLPPDRGDGADDLQLLRRRSGQ